MERPFKVPFYIIILVTLKCCAEQGHGDLRRLDKKVKETLEWSDTMMSRAILVILDSQDWWYVDTWSFEGVEEGRDDQTA